MLLRCYPKVTDWFYFFFNQSPGADYRFLPIYSYGFFVAIGFLAAATLATHEMRRRERLGLLTGKDMEVTVGEAPTATETAFYFLFGFVVGFKLLGLIFFQPLLSKGIMQLGEYIGSINLGSWVGGALVGAAFGGYYYYTKNKTKLPKPVKKTVKWYPSDGMGDIVIIAMVLGVLGSSLFNFLESPDDYAQLGIAFKNLFNGTGNFKSFITEFAGTFFSGLSIYGGLICAATGFGIYAYIKKFSILHFFDSVAPGYMLANGLGRIGCQVSGDGDWGIINAAPKPDWCPQFLWSSHYMHNIINADPNVVIPGCTEEHCHMLANAVYPTPIYEFLMCVTIAAILWGLRKRLTYAPGMLFFVFMILIGIQRFSIEQWRDIEGRSLYHFFGIALRQSEWISIAMIVVGAGVSAYLYNKYKHAQKT